MVKPLDVFLRDHVRAPLREKGFSRKGRDFRLVTPRGDVALVNFFSWRTGERAVEFLLDAGLIPLSWVERRRHLLGEADDGSVASALWWIRPNAPFTRTGTWQFDLDDSERIAVFMSGLTAIADRLRLLADRRNLVSVVRDPAIDLERSHPRLTQQFRHTRKHALALLSVDEGPSQALDEILRALEAEDPADDVASWVRARLSPGRSG